MSATHALATMEMAACELAFAGNHTTAAQLRTARLELAELIDSVDDKLDEIDHRSHGLADSAADLRLRRSLTVLRPIV